MSKEDNKFPILYSYRMAEKDKNPKFVKWSELSESQAGENHGQTLNRLAERQGLSPREIVANVRGIGWFETNCFTDNVVQAMLEEIAL